MFAVILILVISSIGVQSQRRATPACRVGRTLYQSFNQGLMDPEPCFIPPPMVPTRYEGIKITTVPATASLEPAPALVVPAATSVFPAVAGTAMPVIPFITELPNCPDLCFEEILSSPLGCLDPILNIYGTSYGVSASQVSPLSSPLLPPAACDGDSLFLKRIPIPPPFI